MREVNKVKMQFLTHSFMYTLWKRKIQANTQTYYITVNKEDNLLGLKSFIITCEYYGYWNIHTTSLQFLIFLNTLTFI